MKKAILRAYYAQPQEGSAFWWIKNLCLAFCALGIFIIASIAVNAL